MIKRQKDKYISIPGCDYRFTLNELKVLWHFFQCQSKEELMKAACRVGTLLNSAEIFPDESNAFLTLALWQAEALYHHFSALGEPLKSKVRTSTPGRKKAIMPTFETLQYMEEFKKQGMLDIDAVKRVQRVKGQKLKGMPSSVLKRIQEFKKESKESIEQVFKDFEELFD